jgi:Uma2 family endonuclease
MSVEKMLLADAAAEERLYPSSDGEPVAEIEAHIVVLVTLLSILRQFFRSQPDVFVIGNMFWYYEEGNPKARKAPDVMVIKGVDPSPPGGRRSFKSWRENAIPCFILEATSEETYTEDLEKKPLFESLGVREYFLFDPTGEYLPRALVGYRLIQGRYEELQPGNDGTLPSAELGLLLRPEGETIVMTEMRTGRQLATLPDMEKRENLLREEMATARKAAEQEHREMERERRRADDEKRRADEASRQAAEEKRRADEATRQVAEEQRRADEATRQAAEEKRRADEAEKRAAELAAEVERLRQKQP